MLSSLYRSSSKNRKRWLFVLPLAFALSLMVLTVMNKPAQAAPRAVEMPLPAKITSSSPTTIDGPTKIRVGVYMLGVGNLDMTSGGYTLDFYLNFICDRPCDPSKFDIMNASSAPEIDDQTADTRGGTFYTYRVRVDLVTQLDLKKYPFDEHNLAIEIEDKNMDKTKLVYEVDAEKSGIDTHVLVSGWDLRPDWSADVGDHIYPVFDHSAYSRYRFFISIYHPWQASFLKGLFAAIVIVGVGMLSFLLAFDDAEDRVNLTSGTLASAIFYHLTLTSSIPPVGYLTYADQFMLIQYLFISVALGISVALMMLNNRGSTEIAKKLHRATQALVPSTWVIAMLVMSYVAL
jgi:hypothetical protein